jgi:hypothetical protein
MLKSSLLVLFSYADEIMNCQTETGSNLVIESTQGSGMITVSGSAAAGAPETQLPIVTEYGTFKNGGKYSSSLDAGGWVHEGNACSLLIYFQPSNRALTAGQPIGLGANEDSRFQCDGGSSLKIVSCTAGSDLSSLRALENYGPYEIED